MLYGERAQPGEAEEVVRLEHIKYCCLRLDEKCKKSKVCPWWFERERGGGNCRLQFAIDKITKAAILYLRKNDDKNTRKGK